jgi:hypothetical protein
MSEVPHYVSEAFSFVNTDGTTVFSVALFIDDTTLIGSIYPRVLNVGNLLEYSF